MITKPCRILLAAAGTLLPAVLYADDLSKRRPGLWEISETSPADAIARTFQVCIDEATEPLLDNLDMITRRGRCSENKATAEGHVLTLETTCDLRNSRVNTRSTIMIADAGTYRIEARAVYLPPLFGERAATRTQDGKWIGACPTEMKPGDIIADGVPKRNLVGTVRPRETTRSVPIE